MIIRSLIRAHVPRAVTRPALRLPQRSIKSARRYSSSSAPPTASPAPQSQAAMLATVTNELDKIAPKFDIQSDKITIIQTPTEFYETLKSRISTAKHRVYLSTLYIGKTEHELISTIATALRTNPTLRVSFLTDALRGTRETPDPSSASLLAPLITEFGAERVQIRMYHTPNLTGIRKKLIPRRINEGWGLQHMKLYGIDDEIIMSGANLSSDYFTNRQDRYHVFSDKHLTDYFAAIHNGVSQLSFDIQPSSTPGAGGYSMTWPASNPAPSPLTSPSQFRTAATTLLSPLLTPANSPTAPSQPQNPTSKTTIYPLLSLPALLPTSTELPALTTLLTSLSHPPLQNSTWVFTAGYFNTPPSLARLLLATRPAHGTILTAHPHANGFFASPGISGMLPAAYTHLAKLFVRRVRFAGLASRVELREWRRGNYGDPDRWTYHAKGLWITLPPCSAVDAADQKPHGPSISLIGSSNYTTRAYTLDLEANVVIATTDAGLQRRLGREVEWLGEFAEGVGEAEFERPERRVGVGVRASMWLVRVLGGAL